MTSLHFILQINPYLTNVFYFMYDILSTGRIVYLRAMACCRQII